MDYSTTLTYARPGELWTLSSNSYDGLEWLDAAPKPTDAELKAAWPEAKYKSEYDKVSEARRIAYTSESDPVFFQYQRGEKTEQEWLDAVKAVNDANPYPKAPKGVK